MAVQSDTSRISYAGNNSTSTSYAVPFVFLENAHLKAIAKTSAGVESVVTLTNHTGAGDVNGGTVRTSVAIPATSTLTIYRDVPITQTTTYAEGGDFPAASHERALDKLTQISQQNARQIGSSIRFSESTQLNPVPPPVSATPHVLTTVNGGAPTWETVPSVSFPDSLNALTDATTVTAADELIIQQGGITKRATANELLNGTATVSSTGSTAGRTLKDRFADVVNVKDFGAVGDGVTDDTAAIQAALNNAKDNNKPVYGPAGNYLVTSTINIECSGDMSAMIILANATSLSPVVRLGKVSGFPVQSLQIRLPAITNTARVAGDGWVGYENSIGLTVDNIMDSLVTVAQINGFGIGASIGGTDSGNQTNQYFIPFIYRCRLGLLVDRKSVNGWSNENTYYIGKIRKDGNEARVISGITAAASTDTFTKTAHGLTNGTAVAFTALTGGSGLTVDTLSYFVVGATANTFQVSETSGGSPVNILTDYSAATISYPWPDTACIKLGNVNNNVFIRAYVETSMAVDERALILEDSSYNLFVAPRYEILRSGTARLPVLLKGTVFAACTGNCFLAGLDFTTTGAVYAVDAAVTNAVYANTVIGNGRGEQMMSPMALQNASGNGLTTPHLQGVTAGDNALNVGDSFTEWLYRLHGGGLNGKRKADAHSRLRIDWNASNGTGRVFFGDGTVDPTTYITGGQTNLDLVGYSNVRNDGATYTLNQAGTAVIWRAGANSPEGAVTANVGSIFSRTNGGAGTTLYVKESGSGNTGWVAK